MMGTPTLPATLGFSLRNNTPLMGQAAGMLTSSHKSTLPTGLQNSLALTPNLGTMMLANNPAAGISSFSRALPVQTSALPQGFTLAGALPQFANLNQQLNPALLQQQAALATGALTGNAGLSAAASVLNQASMSAPLVQMGQAGNALQQHASIRPQHFDQYGRTNIPQFSSSSSSKLTENDFDEILQRNKTVSSSAINRAVKDAANGDYASAIETLVTAVSLIKQSKIANDDRCRILINSLQDTLHGIEEKSYGSK
ncbi:unnamed protein product [Protopolystoma xenopodis]|uniref:CPSF6/7 RSLD domain-containing protein n=1 Tax=Protopolystoma xenopodis TaxID=117903 RepID=A0A448WXQ0_9PLAT|nr:unnamed protein product [Protopolystoma xenopodis]